MVSRSLWLMGALLSSGAVMGRRIDARSRTNVSRVTGAIAAIQSTPWSSRYDWEICVRRSRETGPQSFEAQFRQSASGTGGWHEAPRLYHCNGLREVSFVSW